MVDRRWGFEDLDDWEYQDLTGQPPGAPAEEAQTVSGQDADRVVTVTATLTGEIVSVRLDTGWKRAVDPRVLGDAVLAAGNAATLAAMQTQLGQIQQPPAPAARQTDTTPLTRQGVGRLLDAVTADLAEFAQRAAAIIDRPVSVESAGGHVSGTAARGRVLQVAVDPGWAARSRASEIESELVDVLGQLRRRSTLGDLAQGPRSAAITELTALASDPATLLSRIGLGPSRPPRGAGGE